MAYDLAKVTDAGNRLVAGIIADKSSLSIDKIEVSNTRLPSTTDITKLTSISDVVQTIQANGFLKNENMLIVSSVLDNSKISEDYKAWVFGIWGSDSQNGQSQLIAVITSTNSPDTIPAFSGRTPVSYTYKFNIGFSNASQIQFNMINDSFATNDTVVHTTGDETIDGQKKFKTDPTDSAGNAYAKTVDVNQQLDKKVNIADMRKPASDVAGIEEVNAKQDRIGYTPADDSKVVHSGDLLGGRNYAIRGKILTVTDNGSGNNYPNELAFEISPGVWGKQVTISYTATISGFNETPNAYVDLKLYNALGGDYTSRGSTQLITKDGDYPVVWKGYIGDLASRGKSQGNFRTSLNSGAKITISKLMIELGNVQHDWVPAIEELADDSKVAHLSGKNNFDTVPTVNHNPLLLASSLPPDLARTGQAQTFTQPQTFSIAPTITDASKDKGDNQAATMADLKSVENSAWLAIPDDKIDFKIGEIQADPSVHLAGSNCGYKLNPDDGKIYLIGGVLVKGANKGNGQIYYLNFDFSDIASKISMPDDSVFMAEANKGIVNGSVINNTTLSFEPNYSSDGVIGFYNYHDFPYVNYTPKS